MKAHRRPPSETGGRSSGKGRALRYVEHVVPVGRRIELFVRDYEPADRADRTIVLLHGAAEHSARHRHVAKRLCGYGWRVVTPDLRGHGLSGGRPMHLGKFADYLDDLERLYDQLDLRPESTVQIGHSMGGLATVRFAQERRDRLAAIALASPLLGIAVRIPPVLLASGRVLSVAYPWKRFRTLVDPANVTRSAESLAERQTDPLHHKSVTARWFFAVQAAIDDAWREAASLHMPVLIVQAGDDRIVDGQAAQAWIGTVGSNDAQFHELEGQFHELHYEDEWPATVDLIDGWLAERVSGMLPGNSTLARAA